jgi:hypothetical protein
MGITDTLISEKELLESVVEYAKTQGWLVYHVFDTFHHAKLLSRGFPDLVLVRDGKLIFAELKAQKGPVTPDQKKWLLELMEVIGVVTYLWRPSDWTAGTIEGVLA